MNITNNLVKSKIINENYDKIQKAKIAYGMEILIENLIKSVVIIALALIFGTLKFTIAAVLAFAFLRYFTFGLHCNSGLACLVLSIILDVISPFMVKDISIGVLPRFVIMLAYVFIIYKYAPADTPNHPLTKESTRRKLKFRAVSVSLFYCLLAVFARPMWLVNIIMLMETFVVISILPITYKIFKRRYNNYEKFSAKN